MNGYSGLELTTACCRIVEINDKNTIVRLDNSKTPHLSVVTCFNDEQTLAANLLESLSQQEELFEVLLIDNTKHTFKSLPVALNLGGAKSLGEYIIFVHQDVYLGSKEWLSDAYRILQSLPNLGAGGVSGISSMGEFFGFIIDRGKCWGKPLRSPVPVQTLDEQLIIIPRRIFDIIAFDERFRFHSYAADMCLTLEEAGHNVLVLPLTVEHNSMIVGVQKASPLEIDDKLLCLKHKSFFQTIQKTTGTLDVLYPVRNCINPLLQSFLLTCQKYLVDLFCGRLVGKILDVGCIPGEQPSLIKLIKDKDYSVGLSDKKRYILVSKRFKVHNDYVIASLDKLPFCKDSFDTSITFGILEYNTKKLSEKIMNAAEKTGKKSIVKVPSLCSPMYPLLFPNKNATYNTFFSCWAGTDFKRRGYRATTFGLKKVTAVLVFAVKKSNNQVD